MRRSGGGRGGQMNVITSAQVGRTSLYVKKTGDATEQRRKKLFRLREV